MGRHTGEFRELLKCVGGKENIAAVPHCVIRMRFVLKDPGKADKVAIERLPTVKGTSTQASQSQVTVGNAVSTYYNDFAAVSGMEGMSKDVAKDVAKQNQSGLQRPMANLAEIFALLILVITVGGLILGLHNTIGEIILFDGGTKTLAELFQSWAGANSFLWLIGEAVLHLLPVCIVWSITRKMGMTQALGIVLGITLVSLQLLSAHGVAGAAATDISVWDFGFFQMRMIGYQAQVLPATPAGFTLVYLECFFWKICPAAVSTIVVPSRSLLLAVIVTHGMLEPVGWKISSMISDFVDAGLTSSFKGVSAAVFGFFYAPLIAIGLHHMSNAINLQLIVDLGGTTLWPMIALFNIAQGPAVLAMTYLQKNDAKAKEVPISSCISRYLGVTEPVMFGVNLKYGFPFFCAMAGSVMAIAISVVFGVKANAIGMGGLPGILPIQLQYMMVFVVAMLVTIVVPSVLAVGVGKREGIGKAAENTGSAEVGAAKIAEMTYQDLKTFLTGNVIAIEDVPDLVFSEKVLGDGIAVEPESSVLVAPTDGTISVVTEGSLHACGITLPDGMELLSHIGLDTVAMNGDGFTAYVKPGDQAKAGDWLIGLDIGKIKAAGHPAVTIMVVTNPGSRGVFTQTTAAHVTADESILAEVQIHRGEP